MIEKKNIYSEPHDLAAGEVIENLLIQDEFKVERIISEGHKSPENFWYDQEENEFVLLLKGKAVLGFDNNEYIELLPGDYIIIPKHCKHRVDSTDNTCKTFWLTVYYS
ncbi:MAG: cupin domain-containing protein [Melioribacteraceae bacterium]|nr:cupin domain-containing protein [Melioribacteraceae bacterium]